MNFGYDAKRLFNNFTGLGNYSRSLLSNLVKFYPEHSYKLYTPKVKETPETKPFLQKTSYKTGLAKGAFKAAWRSHGITRDLVADQIDLYHGLSHELPFNIHKSPVKSIVTIHDLIFKVYPKTYPALDRAIYDYKFKHSCYNSDKIIAISHSTKKDIVELYQVDPEKIDVIYQTCNPIYYIHQADSAVNRVLKEYNLPKNFILSVGSIEERKNVKVLIEAYSQLPSDLKIPLVIIGKGKKYKREVLELIQALRLEKYIIMVNHLTNNTDLQAIYQAATVLVYPSLYEGFGLPVAEALLSKTAVITSNCSSMPEAAGPDQILIDPKNSAELFHALQRVLSDDAHREVMAEKGLAYARTEFSSQNLTQQMMHAYLKVHNS